LTTRKKKGIIFEVEDPTGKRIILEKAAWKSHILRRHPIAGGTFKESFKETIENPNEIIRDKDGTYHYYKNISSEIKKLEFFHPSANYFWVCVKSIKKRFFVFTCEGVPKKKRGKLIWLKR